MTVFGIYLSLCFSSFAVAEEPIKIAAIFAKSGIASEEDIRYLKVIQLAVEEINNEGGILSRPLKVIEIDNKSTPLGAKGAAEEAARLNVIAVIGASWSDFALAMAPVLQKAGIPMITPTATNPKVTLIGDYIFRVCFTDPFQGKVMAQFALQDLGSKTAVVFTNINSEYSMGLIEFFKESFQQGGGKILWEGNYGEKDIDFTELLKKVQTLRPDVIFVPGHERDSALVIKQARKMGINTIFLGGDGWSTKMYEIGGQEVEGNYFSSYWHPEVPFPKAKQLKENYRKKYAEEILIDQPLAYDAMIVLTDAIRRAQSLDREKIKEALTATKEFQGATGTITFDKNGDPINKEAVIMKLEKGTAAFVKAIKP